MRQLSDADGAVSLAKGYDPFGNASWSAGAAYTPYAYTGEQTDANGLVYLRARYYSTVGRFVSRDTWQGNENSPMSFNLWNYVQANPVNYIDPSGYSPCDNSTSEAAKKACEDVWLKSAITFHSQTRNFSIKDKQAIYEGVSQTLSAFKELLLNMGYEESSKGDVFRAIFGTVAFHAYSSNSDDNVFCQRYSRDPKGVLCWNNSNDKLSGHLIAHELAHVYNATFVNKFEDLLSPYDMLTYKINSSEGFTYNNEKGETIKLAEFGTVNGKFGLIRHPQLGQIYNSSSEPLVGEEFAVMFENWVYKGFSGLAGVARSEYITNQLMADMPKFFQMPQNPIPTVKCGWH